MPTSHIMKHDECTPNFFEEVQYLKDFFEHCIQTNSLHHAYLFVGSHYSKKNQFFDWFLSRLPHTECIRLSKTISDEVDSNPVLGVEDVRSCLEYISQTSFERGIRVVLIDDAAKLTQEASNALLKSFEEPHPDILFCMHAQHEYSALRTLASRCHIIRFPNGFLEENGNVQKCKELLFHAPLWHRLLEFEKMDAKELSFFECVLLDGIAKDPDNQQKILHQYDRLIRFYQSSYWHSNHRSDILCLQS